jgi:SAM-dependent methyltransferase
VNELVVSAGKRFARFATRVVVRWPALWRVFRRPLRAQFDALAPGWQGIHGAGAAAPLTAAFERLDEPPARILDLGTGTGNGAQLAAARFPDAEVTGVDMSAGMIAEAGRRLPAELAGRVRFEVGDASALPFPDGAFDLVLLLNMIPFFPEIARLTAPGGAVAIVHGSGPSTPIWTPAATLRRELQPLGFERFEELVQGGATALLARKEKPE